MLFAPLEGWRRGQSHRSPHRRGLCSRLERFGTDIRFSAAQIIVLVQDNLSVHSKAALYEAFPAAEARRLVRADLNGITRCKARQLASNLAESELGVLSSQCFDRRIPDKQNLVEEVAAWEQDRNANQRQGQLALHNPKRTHQTQAFIPVNLTESGD